MPGTPVNEPTLPRLPSFRPGSVLGRLYRPRRQAAPDSPPARKCSPTSRRAPAALPDHLRLAACRGVAVAGRPPPLGLGLRQPPLFAVDDPQPVPAQRRAQPTLL